MSCEQMPARGCLRRRGLSHELTMTGRLPPKTENEMRSYRGTQLITWALLEPEPHVEGFTRAGVRDPRTKRRPWPTCMIWSYYSYLLLVERDCWEDAWSDLNALRGGVVEVVSGYLHRFDEHLVTFGGELLRGMPGSRLLEHLALDEAKTRKISMAPLPILTHRCSRRG